MLINLKLLFNSFTSTVKYPFVSRFIFYHVTTLTKKKRKKKKILAYFKNERLFERFYKLQNKKNKDFFPLIHLL